MRPPLASEQIWPFPGQPGPLCGLQPGGSAADGQPPGGLHRGRLPRGAVHAARGARERAGGQEGRGSRWGVELPTNGRPEEACCWCVLYFDYHFFGGWMLDLDYM